MIAHLIKSKRTLKEIIIAIKQKKTHLSTAAVTLMNDKDYLIQTQWNHFKYQDFIIVQS